MLVSTWRTTCTARRVNWRPLWVDWGRFLFAWDGAVFWATIGDTESDNDLLEQVVDLVVELDILALALLLTLVVLGRTILAVRRLFVTFV
jgi:hypothetical protein